jgi:hypothetical protein
MTAYLRTDNIQQALAVLDKIEKEHYKVASGHTPLARLSNNLEDALKDRFTVPSAAPLVCDVNSNAAVALPVVDGGYAGGVLPLAYSSRYTDTLTGGSTDGRSDKSPDPHSATLINTPTDTHVDARINTLTDTPTDTHRQTDKETLTQSETHIDIDSDTVLMTDPTVAEEQVALSPLRSPTFNTALLHAPARMIIPDIYFGADLQSFILLVISNQLHIRPRIMGTPPHAVNPLYFDAVTFFFYFDYFTVLQFEILQDLTVSPSTSFPPSLPPVISFSSFSLPLPLTYPRAMGPH